MPSSTVPWTRSRRPASQPSFTPDLVDVAVVVDRRRQELGDARRRRRRARATSTSDRRPPLAPLTARRRPALPTSSRGLRSTACPRPGSCGGRARRPRRSTHHTRAAAPPKADGVAQQDEPEVRRIGSWPPSPSRRRSAERARSRPASSSASSRSAPAGGAARTRRRAG